MDFPTLFISLYNALHVLVWAMPFQAIMPFIRDGCNKLKHVSLLQCAGVMASYAAYVAAVTVDNCAVIMVFTDPHVQFIIIAAMGVFTLYSCKCNVRVTRNSSATWPTPTSNTSNEKTTIFNIYMARIQRGSNTAQATVSNMVQKLAGLLLYVFWTATAKLAGIGMPIAT
jgi:hypothetical protein